MKGRILKYNEVLGIVEQKGLVMNMMKVGIILVITISLMVGISSGIFDDMATSSSMSSFGIFDDMATPSSMSSFGIFDDYYTPGRSFAGEYGWVPYNLYDELINSTWEPFNLYDWLNPQPEPEESVDPLPPWPPVPVLPEPVPLSTQEFSTIRSQLSSMKNYLYFG